MLSRDERRVVVYSMCFCMEFLQPSASGGVVRKQPTRQLFLMRSANCCIHKKYIADQIVFEPFPHWSTVALFQIDIYLFMTLEESLIEMFDFPINLIYLGVI